MTIIKHILLLIVLTGVCTAAHGADQRRALDEKAAMYVANSRWNNAAAVYMSMLDSDEADTDDYAMAMIVTTLAGDTATATGYIERSTRQLISVESLLGSIREHSFALGHGSIYETLLKLSRERYPWLARIVDRELLSYYIYRNNGPRIVDYARIMLEGLPTSVYYLRVLADGYMLCGMTSQALEAWLKIMTLDPDNYLTILDIANYHAATGDMTAARPWFERAYRLHPTPYVGKVLECDRTGRGR